MICLFITATHLVYPLLYILVKNFRFKFLSSFYSSSPKRSLVLEGLEQSAVHRSEQQNGAHWVLGTDDRTCGVSFSPRGKLKDRRPHCSLPEGLQSQTSCVQPSERGHIRVGGRIIRSALVMYASSPQGRLQTHLKAWAREEPTDQQEQLPQFVWGKQEPVPANQEATRTVQLEGLSGRSWRAALL